MSRVLRTVLLASLLAPAVAARPQTPFELGPTHSAPWDPLGSHFERALPADITGDGVVDVAILHGQRLILLDSPDRYLAGARMLVGVTSFAVATDASLGRDVALALDGAGLKRCYVSLPDLGLKSDTLATGAWKLARWVRARNEPGSEAALVAALTQDMLSVLLLEFDAGWNATALPEIGFGGTGIDATLVDWDGDGELEIAFLTPVGLGILERDGAVIASFAQPVTGGQVVVLREAWSSAERVALLHSPDNGLTQLLTVLGAAGAEASLDLSGLAVVGMAAGDIDGDGDEDLALSMRSSRELLIQPNLRSASSTGAATFAAGTEVRLPMGDRTLTAPENHTLPVLGDLDLDGDVDAFLAMEDERRVFVHRSQVVVESTQRPVPSEAAYELDASGQFGTFSVDFQAPLAPPRGMTHYEVLVWHQHSAFGNVDSTAFARQLVPFVPGAPLSLQVVLPETALYFRDLYPIEVGLVELDGLGQIVRRGPVIGHTLTMDLVAERQLAVVEDWGPTLSVRPVTNLPGSEPKNPGGFVPRSKIAPFKDSELPNRTTQ